MHRNPSWNLRAGDAPNLRRRRAVVGLSLGAAAAMGVIGAYQVGLIDRLPEPRWPHVSSQKVVGSAEAYRRLKTPDALLGLASYATTAILAAAGGTDRAQTHPWLPLTAAMKVSFDAWNALRMTWHELFRQKAFCLYCMFTTLLTLAMAPLVFSEAREALKTLLDRSRHREIHRPRVASRSSMVRPIRYPWSTLRRLAPQHA